MLCRLSVTSGALLCSLAGCFNPEPNPGQQDTETEGNTSPSTTVPSTTDEPSTSSISETNPTGMTMPEESSGAGVVCGDGVVEGDEVCDDEVNDGSYGSCTNDCSGFGPRCGDNEINGPEVCDDGTNDNSYGGCAADCAALGPYCGDGMLQNAEEMCDNGDANANGGGCNVDCVTSGTQLYMYTTDPLELCAEPTSPVFRDNGNVLVAYGGCSNAWTLLELTPELEVADSTDVLLAGYPRYAIMRGTDWILADYSCNWIVAEDGTLTEICDDARNTGGDDILALDDETYIALTEGELSQFGASSPAAGDTPDWSGLGNADSPPYYYNTYRAAVGALGSIVTVGDYYYSGTSPYQYGYLERFNSSGALLTSRTFSEVTYMTTVASNADGVIFMTARNDNNNTYRIMRLNSNLNVTWNVNACPEYVNELEVDSASQLVMECQGAFPQRSIRKLDEDGNELWVTDLEFEYDPAPGRVRLDGADNIVRTSYEYNSLESNYHVRVEKFAP